MSAAVFDRVAARYDEQWTDTAVGRSQRDQVWRWVDPLFRAGDRILDVGCGTGADAAHFAGRGIRVHAVDASAGMIQAARARASQTAPRDRFTTAVMRAEEIGALHGPYDGAISNFGALNCVNDLQPVARALANLVRPGGRVALCTIGRFCAWETLYFGARLQFSKAVRRWRGAAQSSLGMTVRYPTIAQIRSAFAGFELERWVGIGLSVPPSYVPRGADTRVCRAETRLGALVDRTIAHWPLLRALADHRLLIFMRK